MNSTTIKLYDILRKDLKLNETKSKEFVEAINSSINQKVEQEKSETVTKDFVKKEITEAKNEMIKWGNDMIKWFVGMFFALALMIIGLYIKNFPTALCNIGEKVKLTAIISARFS